MKRITLIVSGKVQQSGYRDKVVEINRNLGLTGFVENLPDGKVKIIAEGDGKKLVKMAESVNIKNTLINVEDIECSYSNASGDFSGFHKHVQDGETDVRLDTAANLLKELIVATNKGFGNLNETITSGFNTIADKQDKMLDKQETSIQILNNINKDTSDIKSSMAKMGIDVNDTRYSLSLFIEKKFNEQEVEIAEIKATLSRMQEAMKASSQS